MWSNLMAEPPQYRKKELLVTESDLRVDVGQGAHRGRLRERTLQAENLTKLLNASSGRDWWNLIRDWTDSKRRPPRVSVRLLYNNFYDRLNPSLDLPWGIDMDVRQLRDVLSGSIPPLTMDHTPQKFFSRPFHLDEVESAKRHLARRHTKASPGLDNVSYQKVLNIPNDTLLRLFNSCIDSLDAPQSWLTTVLVGVLKSGRPGSSPESYRLVGLEVDFELGQRRMMCCQILRMDFERVIGLIIILSFCVQLLKSQGPRGRCYMSHLLT